MEKINGFEFLAERGWEEKVWRKFLDDIDGAGHKQKTSKFLDGILTASEKKFISKRLTALSLIKSGKSYKEIGKLIWISPNTVSGIKKSIFGDTYQSNRYRATKSKNEKRKRIRELPPSTILDYWASLPLPSKTYRRRNRK